MPTRLNAKGPGAFTRDHLLETTGQRDLVGSIYQACKERLQSTGIRTSPRRPTFHSYVWKLKKTGPLALASAVPDSVASNHSSC